MRGRAACGHCKPPQPTHLHIFSNSADPLPKLNENCRRSPVPGSRRRCSSLRAAGVDASSLWGLRAIVWRWTSLTLLFKRVEKIAIMFLCWAGSTIKNLAERLKTGLPLVSRKIREQPRELGTPCQGHILLNQAACACWRDSRFDFDER